MCNLRQFPAMLQARHIRGSSLKPAMTAIKRQTQKFRELARRHQHQDQATLIRVLNPVITGWSRYFSTVISKNIFSRMDYLLWTRLMVWAKAVIRISRSTGSFTNTGDLTPGAAGSFRLLKPSGGAIPSLR